uniref:Uncharacterized protein n=1 Tax=Anguilla anguilla TaxID=7936 RepID=A0A0E9T062_ANGAN
MAGPTDHSLATFIPTGKLDSPISLRHVFGLCEGTGVPSGNPRGHSWVFPMLNINLSA